jgi:hypothetical protein
MATTVLVRRPVPLHSFSAPCQSVAKAMMAIFAQTRESKKSAFEGWQLQKFTFRTPEASIPMASGTVWKLCWNCCEN